MASATPFLEVGRGPIERGFEPLSDSDSLLVNEDAPNSTNRIFLRYSFQFIDSKIQSRTTSDEI